MRPFPGGLLPAQLVGSYTKPPWLTRWVKGSVSAWRAEPDVRAQACRDAVTMAVHDQETAGLDIITDGEETRLHFAGHFVTALGGARDDVADPYAGRRMPALARITGPIHWARPIVVDDLRALRAQTNRPVKMTVIGPLTAANRLADEHYSDPAKLTMACAAAFNAELRALQDAGADVLQVDDPDVYLMTALGVAPELPPYTLDALCRCLDGLRVPTIVHVCYGYPPAVGKKTASVAYADALRLLSRTPADAISLEWAEPGHAADILAACGPKGVLLGVLNLGTHEVETPEQVAARIREALKVVPAERLSVGPDCGMWHLPRQVAFAKLRALALGAAILRAELSRN